MLWKLSLTGLKSRFKDYAILFSGLTLAAAIFYMFLSIALNESFTKGALAIAFATTRFVFVFGIALLALITFVYITYANSFLLSMRKKDYGMYMMLGARTSKIGQLIFNETLVVGLLATILGSVIGIGLTQWVSTTLISQLGLVIHKFVGFYLPAFLWTIDFFTVLFFLAAFWNRHQLVKANVINLLHEDQKPVKIRHNKFVKLIEAILGIGLLATGYIAMAHAIELKLNAITIAFFTIVIGSYFTFDSFFTTVIDLLRANKKFKFKNLHAFTLGQLKFRLTDYTRILSIVSILFALALGAITVGLNFNSMTDQATETTYYDVVLFNKDAAVKKQLKKVSIKEKAALNYKLITTGKGKKAEKILYVSEPEIAKSKLRYRYYKINKNNTTDTNQAYTETITLAKLKSKNENARMSLENMTAFPTSISQVKMVSQKQYDQLKAPNQHIEYLVVNDFKRNFANVDKLQDAANKTLNKQAGITPENIEMATNFTKAMQYRLVLGIASGFEFMGFFLGLAFLAMLASTLMFKVLSGTNSDRPRYKMLWKIGTREKLLKASIAKEIGTLFALPAILGIINVLFGLQFFKTLLRDPYDKIWIPFTIFLVLYLIYYFITVKLYESIVLKRNN
ncbi:MULTISPECIES: FtsX-like permease family protein [Lactobacillus]|uniref:FtsX-like permease family protein n=1 Tax=Lactobacillus TaxID=1578 RepID=UPI000CD95787|nr:MULTISPECIES: FtsX-like permease family protein [Lactobacillus]RVU76864.1 ABC transporter permease [Lactobacillus xujianguonis]